MKCRKRNGTIVDFNLIKIEDAICNAFRACGNITSVSRKTATKVSKQVENSFVGHSVSVEEIQDRVEEILMDSYPAVAKKFILYRKNRQEIREQKCKLLNLSTLDPVSERFGLSSLRVLASRYLLRKDGKIVENPTEMFQRVAALVTIPDILHDEKLFTKYPNRTRHYRMDMWDLQDVFDDDDDNTVTIGEYKWNLYHAQAFIRLYNRLADDGHMKLNPRETFIELSTSVGPKYASRMNRYFDLMANQIFLPNSPTLMNAGARLGQLSACFVLGMEDDLASIMDTAKDGAMIFQSGGGVGINYSKLREEGSIVASTSGSASGPLSFMEIVNTVTNVVKQGGKRRGANMGILDVDHPDIEKFITVKSTPGVLENFNVSVGTNSDFWSDVEEDKEYSLVSRYSRKPIRYVQARDILNLIARSAWESAEPGLIFFHHINDHNPLVNIKGEITATNPCGEQSLYPYESCNLGSINLGKMIWLTDGEPEFALEKFTSAVGMAVQFLDNIIDVNLYPIDKIESETLQTRRIGLGVMGFADMLMQLKIGYNTKEGYHYAKEIGQMLDEKAKTHSRLLAQTRGSYPANSDSLLRNSYVTTIAPTGSISMIAECSNGIEPVFSFAYEKRVAVGDFTYKNAILERAIKNLGLDVDKTFAKIVENYGSIMGIKELEKITKYAVTAMDIHWADHIMMQSIWQSNIDNAISKTINMPTNITPADVKAAYVLAEKVELKGITVYRDGSRHTQVLNMKEGTKPYTPVISEVVKEFVLQHISGTHAKNLINNAFNPNHIIHDTEMKRENCECGGEFIREGGCQVCNNCGLSSCSVS